MWSEEENEIRNEEMRDVREVKCECSVRSDEVIGTRCEEVNGVRENTNVGVEETNVRKK